MSIYFFPRINTKIHIEGLEEELKKYKMNGTELSDLILSALAREGRAVAITRNVISDQDQV